MDAPTWDDTQDLQAPPTFEETMPHPADAPANRSIFQNALGELKSIPGALSNMAGKASDVAAHGMDAATGMTGGADALKQDFLNAGNTVYQALPHPTSTSGKMSDFFTGPWDKGAVISHFEETGKHPLQSLHDRPIGTLGDVATAVAPFLGGAEAGAIEGAADTGQAAGAAQAAGGASKLQGLADFAAKPFDAVAIKAGRQALGNTKRFLNNPAKEAGANQAAKVALEEGVITPLANAETMRARAQALEKMSGQGIGDFLKNQSNVAAENAPPPAMPDLPVTPPGAKTGDPHALFAYNDQFGPGGSERSIYNVYGDPTNPAIQKVGFGSSVSPDALDQAGIKVTGREPRSAPYQPIGNIPGVPTPPPQANPYLFNSQKAMEDLESLRPQFRGGLYDQQHAIIDKALSTIKAHGNAPINWDEANALKGTLQDAANWKNNAGATALDRQVAGAFRGNLDSQLENAATQTGNAEGFQDFLGNKQKYQAANQMQDVLQNRISSEQGNKTFGITDTIMGGSQLAMGHPVTAIASVVAKKALEAYGPQTIASGSFKLANIIKATPQALGPYADVLSKAAARGDQALAATDYVLQQRDPSYRQMLQGLGGLGELSNAGTQ